MMSTFSLTYRGDSKGRTGRSFRIVKAALIIFWVVSTVLTALHLHDYYELLNERNHVTAHPPGDPIVHDAPYLPGEPIAHDALHANDVAVPKERATTLASAVQQQQQQQQQQRQQQQQQQQQPLSSLRSRVLQHLLFGILQRPRPGTPIPLVLPPNKVSVVLMNHSRPRMIRESTLLRTLLGHPSVGEVVLLHANPRTRFEFVHDKVVNVDATRENDAVGLALRFYFCQSVAHAWVVHVDDDMEFDAGTLDRLLVEFGRNTRRIVGRFGRDARGHPGQHPLVRLLNGHDRYRGYWSVDTHGRTEVVLTKLMIMERDVCPSFFRYTHLVWDDIVAGADGPLWNGEDIFMSLVANHVYGGADDNNYAMDWLEVTDAPNDLKDYDHGEYDISGGHTGLYVWRWKWWQSLFRRNRHYAARGHLWQTAKARLAALKLQEEEEAEEVTVVDVRSSNNGSIETDPSFMD